MALDCKQPKGYRKAWNGGLKPQRWGIRILYPDGGVAWLRHGSRVGYGPIVRFTDRQTAEVNLDFVKQGLDDGVIVSVVPITADIGGTA